MAPLKVPLVLVTALFACAAVGCVIDLVFVVDGSTSITPGDWLLATGFLANVSQHLNVSAAGTAVGLVQFASESEIETYLTGNLPTLQAIIANLRQMQGNTDMGDGLIDAWTIFKAGSRPNTPKVSPAVGAACFLVAHPARAGDCAHHGWQGQPGPEPSASGGPAQEPAVQRVHRVHWRWRFGGLCGARPDCVAAHLFNGVSRVRLGPAANICGPAGRRLLLAVLPQLVQRARALQQRDVLLHLGLHWPRLLVAALPWQPAMQRPRLVRQQRPVQL